MIVVVWKKTERARTHLMTVFTTATLDQINTNRAKKSVIPIEAPFIELGIGKAFINKWKDKYKIKKISYWPPETK